MLVVQDILENQVELCLDLRRSQARFPGVLLRSLALKPILFIVIIFHRKHANILIFIMSTEINQKNSKLLLNQNFITGNLDTMIMPRRYRRRRRMAMSPIQSVKQVGNNNFSTSPATKADQVIQQGVDNYTGPDASNIQTPVGAKIYRVELQVSIVNSAAAVGTVHYYIAKSRGGQTFGEFPDPDDVGGSDVRNQILHQEQFSFGTNDAGAINRTHKLRIPAGMQRIRENDRIRVVIKSTVAVSVQYQWIYKFYR